MRLRSIRLEEKGASKQSGSLRFISPTDGTKRELRLTSVESISLTALHQANDPTENQNGIAICSLHHRLFGKGAFTLQPDLKIVVSEKVSGTGLKKLGQFDGGMLPAPPLSMSHRPNADYIKWHNKQVFLGDAL